MVNEKGGVDTSNNDDAAAALMSVPEATQARARAARANSLIQVRAGIQYAGKDTGRRMAAPREGDLRLPKRLGR